jgi:hypothetical protein
LLLKFCEMEISLEPHVVKLINGDLHFTKFRRQRIKRFFSFKKSPNLLRFALILVEKFAKERSKLISTANFASFPFSGIYRVFT